MKNKSDIEIRNMLNEVRRLSGTMLFENEETNNDGESGENVPYTMQDELMSSIIETTRTQFGASYDKDVKNPMLYYPESGDITLSGVIGSLQDAKFQFKYKGDESTGCNIWVQPLKLNDANIKTLSVIYGTYTNWKKELDGIQDKKPMSMRNENTDNSQQNSMMVPGDDF